ncbi:OLC1v1002150C1 [Oldenlandia corymbosa var. corymbosa]|uniref:OLC1v1002150C1 n=1 Tax=Oldenlandia corymbosa var. corymbosa TaxID=529605 RepID=A0AAV1D6Y7_OLDCO|nr:OLC1v1002150C1 [Oldenlandia corymbosa var. corymbosa]
MGLYIAIVLIAVSFAAPVISNPQKQPTTVKEWCATTYNPEPCEHVLTNNPKYGLDQIKGKDDFIKVSVQLAYDRALNASRNVHTLGPKSKTAGEKAALAQCVDLYDKNVVILNQTIHQVYICNSEDLSEYILNEKAGDDADNSQKKCTAFDVLAKSLNNIDDCEEAFFDIDMTDNVMTLIRDSVLEDLIVNALALNAEKLKVAGLKPSVGKKTASESAQMDSSSEDVEEGEEYKELKHSAHSDYTAPHTHPPHHN